MEPMTRRNAVARAVLLWLYDEDENYPLVEDFLELPAANVDGEVIGNDELVRTVRWLDDRPPDEVSHNARDEVARVVDQVLAGCLPLLSAKARTEP